MGTERGGTQNHSPTNVRVVEGLPAPRIPSVGTISQVLAAARYGWKGQGCLGSEAGAAPSSLQATGALPPELGLGVDVSSAPNGDEPPEGWL